MTMHFVAVAGGVEVAIDGQELAVLRAIPGFLASVAADGDPLTVLQQGRPSIYVDDDTADQEFRRLVADDLSAAQAEDRATLTRVLDRVSEAAVVLDVDEAAQMLRAMTATRLALAARNGMFEFDELPEVPETPQQMLVAFLGMLQDELVGAMGDVARMDQ